MRIATAFCTLRDRSVYITLDEPAEADQDLEIMCMDYGYGPLCTGDFCPNFGLGNVYMGIRPPCEHCYPAAALR